MRTKFKNEESRQKALSQIGQRERMLVDRMRSLGNLIGNSHGGHVGGHSAVRSGLSHELGKSFGGDRDLAPVRSSRTA